MCERACQYLNSLEKGSAVSLPADISQEQECIRVARYLSEVETALHLLFNNAGCGWYNNRVPLCSHPPSIANAFVQGSSARLLSNRRLRKSVSPQRVCNVFSLPRARAAALGWRHRRGPGSHRQHQLDLRNDGAAARDLRLSHKQSCGQSSYKGIHPSGALWRNHGSLNCRSRF